MERRTREDIIRQEAGKPGLRGRINAMCTYCLYSPSEPGTWRKQVQSCTSPACPLYEVRPTAGGKDVS